MRQEAGARQPVLIAAKNRPVLWRGRGDSSFGIVQPGLCEAGDEFLEDVGHLDERADRDKLVDAVVAVAARRKVGTGQAAERQLCTVGAAANRQHLGLNIAGKEGFLGDIDQLWVVADDLGHVTVLVLDLDRYALLAQTLVEQRGGSIHQLELLLELGGIVITDDIARRGMVDRGRNALEVIEALVVLGVFRALRIREQRVKVAEQIARVDHAALGVTGMDGLALKVNGCLGGVKALPLQLANGTAVDRVGVLAAKGLDVQQLGAVTDLFVWAKTNAECGVGQRGVLSDTRDKRHDLGDAGLVVGAQQRGAVTADQVLTHKVVQGGKLGGAHGHGLAVNGTADQVAAFVVYNVWLHAGARRNLGGVEVRDQAQGGLVLRARARRNMRADVGMLGHMGIGCTKLVQFLGKHIGKIKLDGARRNLVTVGILGLCVDLDVAQKTLKDVGVRGGVFHRDRSNLGCRVQQEL